MNPVIEQALKRCKPVKIIYLEPFLNEQGRRLREASGFWDIQRLRFLGQLIEIRFYKGQAVLKLCPAWVEPELLRQLLVWSEKGAAPGLIIKNFKDVMGMEVT
jgi:hypothetical protein